MQILELSLNRILFADLLLCELHVRRVASKFVVVAVVAAPADDDAVHQHDDD